MSSTFNIAIAQRNFLVGAVKQNLQKIVDTIATCQGADLVVFPELALTGYPPEDLLLRDELMVRVKDALEQLQQVVTDTAIVVGHPWKIGDKLYNAASVIHQGHIIAGYVKQHLPNYSVFDEKRYFTPGDEPCVFELKGVKIGLVICEDLWHSEPALQAQQEGAEILVAPNASPFNLDKHEVRVAHLQERVKETGLPIVYVNHVGGQDELVFDGHSLVLDKEGNLKQELPKFVEAIRMVQFENFEIADEEILEPEPEEKAIYDALVLAVQDYVQKNGFSGVVLGLSGGIDSALTLAIAVDALGPDKVQAVMMPFRYTSSMSVEDAQMQAQTMGVEFDIVSIEQIFAAFNQQLGPLFIGTIEDTTEENLQARARGVLLMAISNKKKRLVLTTGNKSELAVGYCTLYGDMCGGFSAIKDIPKTLVYKLSSYRNTISPAIPQRVIDRPPSAELAPDQVDQDSLPDYDILDKILEMYIEQDKSVAEIIAEGFDESVVRRVTWLVDINEYKRRQAAIGPKITSRNFGKDRRYPITSGYGREN